jgi:hypothetical protein
VIALDGPVINPTPGHARNLARAFNRVGEDVRIVHGRWLPTGPQTPGVAALLRRVDDLEVECRSTGASARRRYRERYSLRSLRATMDWLRDQSIEPTVYVTVGIPGDDQYTLLETLRAAYSLRPFRVQLHPMTVPPGSHFDRNRRRYGVSTEPDPPFKIARHITANALELKWLIKIARTSIAGYNKWSKLSRRRGP